MNSIHLISKIRSAHCASILVTLAFLLASGPALGDAVVKQVIGQVEIGRGEPPEWSTLTPGDKVGSEDRVRTGADGRVEISMSAGTVRVHENSMLRLPPASGDADQVELDEGHSLFDVLRRAGRRFEVHTPTVVVSVKGTRFGVDASGSLGEVAVYRGVVGVREAGIENAMETLVREGFLAAGGPGVPIELDVSPAGDPWAGWQDFQREGQERREAPARLDEVGRARESLLRSADPEVLRRASERRPEVAERLRAIKAERSARSDESNDPNGNPRQPGGDPPSEDSPGTRPAMPAAPMMGDEDRRARGDRGRTTKDVMTDDANELSRHEMKRLNRTQENLRDVFQAEAKMRPEEMTGLSGAKVLDPENMEFAFDRLNEEYGSALVLVVYEAMNEAGSILESSGTLFNADDLLDQTEIQLLEDGMDPVLVQEVESTLTGK